MPPVRLSSGASDPDSERERSSRNAPRPGRPATRKSLRRALPGGVPRGSNGRGFGRWVPSAGPRSGSERLRGRGWSPRSVTGEGLPFLWGVRLRRGGGRGWLPPQVQLGAPSSAPALAGCRTARRDRSAAGAHPLPLLLSPAVARHGRAIPESESERAGAERSAQHCCAMPRRRRRRNAHRPSSAGRGRPCALEGGAWDLDGGCPRPRAETLACEQQRAAHGAKHPVLVALKEGCLLGFSSAVSAR